MAFGSNNSQIRKSLLVAGGIFVSASVLAACGGSSSSSESSAAPAASGAASEAAAPAAGKSVVYFTNNFADNDWRQQMQKSVELAATLPEYADRVELKVSNSGVSPQEQSAMLDNIIANGDAAAIIMEAASPDAVNPAIQRACDAGIKVVTFDSTATAPCAYKVSVDWKYNGMVTAAWVTELLGGKGKVAVDYGLKGLTIGNDFLAGVQEEMAKYPGMEIVGTYEGGFNPGQEKKGTAAILASNPDLDASMTMYVGSPAGEAFKEAGKDKYIYVGTANNKGATECAADAAAQCIFWDDSPAISILALNTALDAIDNKNTDPATPIIMNAPNGSFYAKGPGTVAAYPNAPIQQWEDGVNFFSSLSPALALPILPAGIDLPITAEQLSN